MNRKVRIGLGVTLCAVLLGASGCFSLWKRRSTERFDVVVNMNEWMADASGILPSVEVHLTALHPDKGRLLQALSMSQYWDPNREHDDYIKHVMKFGEDQPRAQSLSRDDPIWRRWEGIGATYLFVLADLPGHHEDLDNVQDPRRLTLPLNRSLWRGHEINIMIEETGIFSLTPRKKVSN